MFEIFSKCLLQILPCLCRESRLFLIALFANYVIYVFVYLFARKAVLRETVLKRLNV